MKYDRIKIDANKCVGCGLCAEDCVGCHIRMVEDGEVSRGVGETLRGVGVVGELSRAAGVVGEKSQTGETLRAAGEKSLIGETLRAHAEHDGNKCIECGHCYAICPVEAITIDGYDYSSCKETFDMSGLDSDKLLLAMKSRRSVRHFTSDPVPDEDIAKILEAGRYCPTAVNYQDVEYIVMRSGEGSALEELDAKGKTAYREACERGEKWAKSAGLVPLDDTFFFRSAPLVILIASRNPINAALAAAYMELMAESLGLGVLYVGRIIRALVADKDLAAGLGLRDKYEPVACLAIGHPDPRFNYKRGVPRKALKSKEM